MPNIPVWALAQTAISASTCRTSASGCFNFITVGDCHVSKNQTSCHNSSFLRPPRFEDRFKICLVFGAFNEFEDRCARGDTQQDRFEVEY